MIHTNESALREQGADTGHAISAAKNERRSRKAALQEVRDRFPHARGKGHVLLIDHEILEDFLAEKSRFAPDDPTDGAGALRFISAQLASGTSLRTISEHYCVAYGLLCDWLIENPQRLARCKLAWETGRFFRGAK